MTFWPGGQNDELILGGGGEDRLQGGGADSLLGGNLDDIIGGNAGADFLFDGAGNDKLNGGGGPDTFVYISPDLVPGGAPSGTDIIRGFDPSKDTLLVIGPEYHRSNFTSLSAEVGLIFAIVDDDGNKDGKIKFKSPNTNDGEIKLKDVDIQFTDSSAVLVEWFG